MNPNQKEKFKGKIFSQNLVIFFCESGQKFLLNFSFFFLFKIAMILFLCHFKSVLNFWINFVTTRSLRKFEIIKDDCKAQNFKKVFLTFS